MKVWTNETKETRLGRRHCHDARTSQAGTHPAPRAPGAARVEFDEQSWALWEQVFGDDDTVGAAAEILRNAPPEIQILAVQLIAALGQARPPAERRTRRKPEAQPVPGSPRRCWERRRGRSTPDSTGATDGVSRTFWTPLPDEIAVVSRLIAYLAQREEG